MTDLERRIKGWTDAASEGVAPVSTHEVYEIASRSRRHPKRALAVATTLIVIAATGIGLAMRSHDRNTVVTSDAVGENERPDEPSSSAGNPAIADVDDYDIESLMANLTDQGADVRRMVPSNTTGPMLLRTIPANLCVNRRTVQVFEYETAEERAAVSDLISDDGSNVPTGDGTAIVEWIDPPHFYTRGRIIALYLGPIDDLAAVLESLLGPPLSPDAVAGGNDGVEPERC